MDAENLLSQSINAIKTALYLPLPPFPRSCIQKFWIKPEIAGMKLGYLLPWCHSY